LWHVQNYGRYVGKMQQKNIFSFLNHSMHKINEWRQGHIWLAERFNYVTSQQISTKFGIGVYSKICQENLILVYTTVTQGLISCLTIKCNFHKWKHCELPLSFRLHKQ
jgi:hypothetical protein